MVGVVASDSGWGVDEDEELVSQGVELDEVEDDVEDDDDVPVVMSEDEGPPMVGVTAMLMTTATHCNTDTDRSDILWDRIPTDPAGSP